MLNFGFLDKDKMKFHFCQNDRNEITMSFKRPWALKAHSHV